MSHSFVAYIDESGCDGFKRFRAPGRNGSTQWLTLSACVVSADSDRLLPFWRDEIKGYFSAAQRRDLHFRDLDHSQKLLVCREVALLPLRFISVLSNKTTILSHSDRSLFKKKNTLYWYLARYLVERISWYCKRRIKTTQRGDGTVRIVFARRGGMSYDHFRSYLQRLKMVDHFGETKTGIYWPAVNIEDVDAQDASRRAGLQFADVAASGFSAAVEADRYGNYEPRYADLLLPRVMISRHGRYLGYGVKPVPNLNEMSLSAEQRTFFAALRKKGGGPPAPVPPPALTAAAR